MEKMNSLSKDSFDIFDQINFHIKNSGDKKAIIFPKKILKNEIIYESISNEQLNRYSNKLGNYFKKNGIQKGDKVVVFLPVSLMLYLVIFALIKTGAVVVFIDPWIGIKNIKECCKLTKPKGFIGNVKASILKALSTDIRKIPFKLTFSKNDLSSLDYIDKLCNDENLSLSVYKPKDSMFIRFTTGSTGKPKGVDRSYEYICSLFKAISDFFNIKEDDIDLTTYPLNILYDLVMGATVVIPLISYGRANDFEPEIFVKQLKQNSVTTASASPFFWSKLVYYCKENNIKFKKLRFIFTGGGPVSLDLLKNFNSVFEGANIFIVYGSSEVFPISWINIQDINNSTIKETINGKGICLGKIHPNLNVKIIDKLDESKKLKNNDIGEIIVTGPHVNKSYFNDSGELFSKNKIVEDDVIWHKTGDAGYFNEKGRLWLVGRSENIFSKNNKKISSLMIEYIADSLPEISKSALVKNNEDKLFLFVKLKSHNLIKDKNEKVELVERIKKHIKQKVIDIDKVIFVKDIPLDIRHQTKIDYNSLKNKQYLRM